MDQEIVDLIEPHTVPPTPPAEPTTDAPRDGGRRKRDYKAERARRREREAAEAARPRPVSMDDVLADIQPPGAKPARSRSRAKKITGSDVAAIVEHASVLVVMLTRHEHWHIPASEVQPWAGEAAELLNRIPSRYISAAAGASSWFAVGFGLYSTVAPRLAESERLNAERAAAKRAAKTASAPAAVGADDLPGRLGDDTPWATAAD